MQSMLFMAHSGVRYLVLLAAVIALVMAALNWSRTESGRGARIAGSVFTGVLDLQLLLGLVLLMQWPWQPMLIGHIAMMLLAVVVAHTGMVLARRREPQRAGSPLRAASIALALLLIVGGIMALGRGVFESSGM